MKTSRLSSILCGMTLLGALLVSQPVLAAPTLVALSTDGVIYQVDTVTGVQTEIVHPETANFTLGGIARKKNNLYYISTPSGSDQNAIYTINVKTGEGTFIDLDRAQGDDEVRALFFSGKKLYAIFYNGTAGTAGLYQLDPKTGVTTQKLDWSDLNVEIIGGSFVQSGKFFYVLVRPENDNTVRKLLKFRFKAASVKLLDLVDKSDLPVLCDRIKVNSKSGNFVCLASPTDSQVDVCKVTPLGKATCLGTLENVKRVGGGHTFVSRDGKNFFAFVYEPDDVDHQTLIQLNARGVIKSRTSLDSIMVGAQFDRDGLPPLTK